MNFLKKLSKKTIIIAFQKSINALLKNPKIIAPFVLELVIPALFAGAFIMLFLGPEAFNFYYNPNVYLATDPNLLPKIFFTALAGMIASIFIISYIDVAGILMCNKALKGKKMSLVKAFEKAPRHWVNQTIVMFSLTLIGFCFLFVLLALVTLGVPYPYYYAYSIIGALSYFVIILYPRFFAVLYSKTGFDAIKDSLKFVLDNPKLVLKALAIIIIVYGAFSWLYVLNPGLHQVFSAVVLFPWFNVFLIAACFVKKHMTAVAVKDA